jgi:hypothetical protein
MNDYGKKESITSDMLAPTPGKIFYLDNFCQDISLK